jgi:MFS family permease
MVLAGVAVLISAPAGYFAIRQPRGALASFVLFQAAAWLLMYVYYAAVYSTIHDIVEPALRGTGIALYFFAMYVLGASLGPLGTGWLSDNMARRAAIDAHVILLPGSPVPEHFKAVGLHRAMYLVPILGILLAVVLFGGALTVRKDMERLHAWMERVSYHLQSEWL